MLIYISLYYLNGLSIPLILCFNLSSILFVIGLVGIIWNKKNILIMLLCIEMMFFAVGLNFLFISMYVFSTIGQILCLFVITLAAAETAIGLSLSVILMRLGNKVTYQTLITLRS